MDDEIGLYITKLAHTDSKLSYWHSMMEDKYHISEVFKYQGICLWDVFSGNIAPNDLFPKANLNIKERKHFIQSILYFVKMGKKVYLIIKNTIKTNKHMKRYSNPILFVSFERRQIDTFKKTIGEVKRNNANFYVLTTNTPSHSFPSGYEYISNTVYLEHFQPGILSIYGLLISHAKLSSWLNFVLNDICSGTEKEKYEIKILINFIKDNLFNVLLLIDTSNHFISKLAPKNIISADNADLRARVLFLVARKYNIPVYHLTYGFVGFDCFEEKHMIADKKFVYSSNQKELIKNHFLIDENKLVALGCPRFDDLFALRKHKKETNKPIFTILFGSQPHRKGTYGLITKELKTEKIEMLFATISNLKIQTKLLIKPHPDESREEVEQLEVLAKKYGIPYEVIHNIDFQKASAAVDLFVTFFSTLGIEFMILDIPVCFLYPVKNIPILNEACIAKSAYQIDNKKDFGNLIENLLKDDNKINYEKREAFLKKEFTNTDGTASVELAKFLMN